MQDKKTKVEIKNFNKENQSWTAITENGEKIIVTVKAFDNKQDYSLLAPKTKIECNIFNSRQKGYWAYSAKVL